MAFASCPSRVLAAALVIGYAGPALASNVSPAEVVTTVRPAAAGRQVVRLALPLPRGFLTAGQGLEVRDETGSAAIQPGLRPLTWRNDEQPSSARRALVTFAYDFPNLGPTRFHFRSQPQPRPPASPLTPEITVTADTVEIREADGTSLTAKLIAPARTSAAPVQVEEVESNADYQWKRYVVPDPSWPRIIEVRTDVLGTTAVVGHLQRGLAGDGWGPELGWRIVSNRAADKIESGWSVVFDRDRYRLYHPVAPFVQSGPAACERQADGFVWTYRRIAPGDKVALQERAWRKAEFVVGPTDQARLTWTLQSPHTWTTDGRLWDDLYATGNPLDLSREPVLAKVEAANRAALLHCMELGQDFGNVSSFEEGRDSGGLHGMNRLNHCPPIFEAGWRDGDRALLDEAVLWCDNTYDLTIWWGAKNYGGTRYPDVRLGDKTPFEDDKTYMWRSDSAIDFCTKGYDSFFLAYEETGDPRMLEAFRVQSAFGRSHVEALKETRNIGDIRDLMDIRRYTGDASCRADALRLFREYRSKASAGGLVSQQGRPIEVDPPFIDDDEFGYRHPFAKPYILSYALSGLSSLVPAAPDEPDLKGMLQRVADFMAESQDPVGGWRYPHPLSSGMHLGMAIEFAWGLARADQVLGVQDKHLDAIERALRQRVALFTRARRFAGYLGGWELSTGKIKDVRELSGAYARPTDRDRFRDYREGAINLKGDAPESFVFLDDLLRFYLQHRPAKNLLEKPEPDTPLGLVLDRVYPPAEPPKIDRPEEPGMYQTVGVKDYLPVFRDALANRLTFPFSFTSGHYPDFAAWNKAARERYLAALLPAPPAVPFNPQTIAVEDRGSYWAKKVVLHLTGDSRVLAFVLVPKGAGPFPAALLLHDHGGRFDIGKEKMIRPFRTDAVRLASADEWSDRLYGGRFVGDELARRGYYCFCVDALNWSDRGGAGASGQQALGSNLLHLGISFAGLIAHEDLRAADFVAAQPEVDAQRIAAVGLSMGGFRTWQIAALSDHIAAGVSICWMATVKGLMVPGNNQTVGQSAFAMLHPGIFDAFDYPDLASIACPKPMLFFGGLQDHLFPVPSVREAYAKMHQVWASQGADDRLVTKLWDVPHLFSASMQDEAFAWLDRQLKR